MRTIAQQWKEFEALVLPLAASNTQRTEMRRAFYVGFHSALIAAVEMADESRESTDIGVTLIQRLHDEVRQFAEDIAAGRA